MPKKFQVTWKAGKSKTGEAIIDTPVIALNLRMIDRRLKKEGLRELSEIVDADGASISEVVSTFESALEYFVANPSTLPFSDLLVEEIPIAIKALQAIPRKTQVRFTVVG